MKTLQYDHMLKPTDPEGNFSTLSALFTAYGGYWLCLVMRDNKSSKKEIVKNWLSYAVFFVLLSLPISMFMPYNKKLWSTSFAMLTVGISGCMLVIMLLLIDVAGNQPNGRFNRPIDIFTRPFLWLGMNPLAIFVLMDLTAILMIRIITINNGESLWHAFYNAAFKSWISNP
jgi:predicted acyltransferase